MADRAEVIVGRGPWAQVIGFKGVLCPDGRRRKVMTPTGADSFFTAPGRVKVKGKTVSGFVTSHGSASPCGRYDYRFVPTGKNVDVLVGSYGAA